MCLILFAYHVHPKYKLIVAANRDEFYKRRTAPAHYWEDYSNILAGRDLKKMGTWMGVTKTGRFSALTNYRNPKEITEGKRSRGELVANALKFEGNIEEYLKLVDKTKEEYPGYNLLVGDQKGLYYYSNVRSQLQKLKPGIYGISNHLLNTDWPKVKKGKIELTKIINESEEKMVSAMFSLLQDRNIFPDEHLPKTGVSQQMERMLSPLFIKSADYGTRSSTLLFMSENEIDYIEHIYVNGSYSEQKYKIFY